MFLDPPIDNTLMSFMMTVNVRVRRAFLSLFMCNTKGQISHHAVGKRKHTSQAST